MIRTPWTLGAQIPVSLVCLLALLLAAGCKSDDSSSTDTDGGSGISDEVSGDTDQSDDVSDGTPSSRTDSDGDVSDGDTDADVSDGDTDADVSDGDTDADVSDGDTDADVSDGDTDADVSDGDTDAEPAWNTVLSDWPSALLSVGGSSADNVWVAGARVGNNPTLLQWDGTEWEDHDLVDALGAPAVRDVDLWWLHVFDDDHLFAGGSDGAILRRTGVGFERMRTPGLARHTVFGIWGSAPDDVYAVGGIGARSGFVWHWDGDEWRALPLPADMPKLANGSTAGLFKVCGDGDGTVWFVGNAGTILRRVGDGPIEVVPSGIQDLIFTVDVAGDDVVAVGGSANGVIVDIGPDGGADVAPLGAPLLQGVAIAEEGGEAWAVGAFGDVWRRNADGTWERQNTGLNLDIESLHAVWIDPDGGVWAAGGNVMSPALDEGVLVVRGRDTAAAEPPEVPEPPTPSTECPEHDLLRGAHGSVARRWNEQTLASIRRVIPEPGVHARNLYSLSVALFDAWAAFEPAQPGLIITETAADLSDEARDEAMSYAAYRLLRHRYARGAGAPISQDCYRRVMEDLGYDPDDLAAEGPSPRALGNRIGEAVIAAFADDGAREDEDYHEHTYVAPNPPLVVDQPGVGEGVDPTLWQPLNLARAVTQNGIAVPGGPQRYISPHWRDVTPFAITRPDGQSTYFEPRPATDLQLGELLTQWTVDIIRFTSWLDPNDGEMMDISPGAYGNNPLASNDGTGHPVNPVTGEPYAPQVVPRGDFGRVLISYWADGPSSETPPGHWNTILNRVTDHPDFEPRWRGQGEPLDQLDFDVHAYLVLNGALHDAAIVAWELKREYESARPITLVRWMGAQGQSSDPDLPSYDPDGLPLVDGLIELITQESSAPGERHELLAPHIGEIAIVGWPGEPGYRHAHNTPAQWMRAVEWVAWMPDTFVSPAFPGYTSGHSTFSRAAATVMAGITGSDYHPGGLGEFVATAEEYLEVEHGPSVEVRLQYATWFDAADQAGQSRIWSAIHIHPDDMDGRRSGAWTGTQALSFAESFLALE